MTWAVDQYQENSSRNVQAQDEKDESVKLDRQV